MRILERGGPDISAFVGTHGEIKNNDKTKRIPGKTRKEIYEIGGIYYYNEPKVYDNNKRDFKPKRRPMLVIGTLDKNLYDLKCIPLFSDGNNNIGKMDSLAHKYIIEINPDKVGHKTIEEMHLNSKYDKDFPLSGIKEGDTYVSHLDIRKETIIKCHDLDIMRAGSLKESLPKLWREILKTRAQYLTDQLFEALENYPEPEMSGKDIARHQEKLEEIKETLKKATKLIDETLSKTEKTKQELKKTWKDKTGSKDNTQEH